MEGQIISENPQSIFVNKILSSNIYSFIVKKIKSINFAHLMEEVSVQASATRRRGGSLLAKLFGNNFGGGNPSNKKFYILVGIVLIVVVVLGGLVLMVKPGTTTLGVSDSRPSAPSAKAKQDIRKVFQFPIRDEKGKEISNFSYEITSAELLDSIIVKAQRQVAVKGRIFLVFNLKITNNNNQSVNINTRDYVRLRVGNNSELVAPEIHNDPVEAQAISTKYTRLGFPIDESEKDLTLQVGEITGKKETIRVNF